MQPSPGPVHSPSSNTSEPSTPTSTPTPTLHDRAPIVTDDSVAKSGEIDAASHLQPQVTASATEATSLPPTAPDELDSFAQDSLKVVNTEPNIGTIGSGQFYHPRLSRGGHDKPAQPLWPPPRRESLTVGASRIWVGIRTSNLGPTPQASQRGKGSHPPSTSMLRHPAPTCICPDC